MLDQRNAEILMIIEQIKYQQNIELALCGLATFFFILGLFNIIFSMTAVLFVSEASMIIITSFLTTAVTINFPIMSADTLNILNASAMEAIVGILIVIHVTFGWLSRPDNVVTAYLEASVLKLVNKLEIYEKKYNFNTAFIKTWMVNMFTIFLSKTIKDKKLKLGVNCLNVINILEKILFKYMNKVKIYLNTFIVILISLQISYILVYGIININNIYYYINIYDFFNFLPNLDIKKIYPKIIKKVETTDYVQDKLVMFTKKINSIREEILLDNLTKDRIVDNINYLAYSRVGNLEKINIITNCRLNTEKWESIGNNYLKNPNSLLRAFYLFETNLKGEIQNDKKLQNYDKYFIPNNLLEQLFQTKEIKQSSHTEISTNYSQIINISENLKNSGILNWGIINTPKTFLGILPLFLNLENKNNFKTLVNFDLKNLNSKLPDFYEKIKKPIKHITILQNSIKQINQINYQNSPWYVKQNSNFFKIKKIKKIPLFKETSTNNLFSNFIYLGDNIIERYLILKIAKQQEIKNWKNWILTFNNFRPHRFLVKQTNNIPNIINLKKEKEELVILGKYNEFIGWSTKNFGALFSYYSKLLPWWENSNLDNEILDFTEKPILSELLSLSEVDKLVFLGQNFEFKFQNSDIWKLPINTQKIDKLLNLKDSNLNKNIIYNFLGSSKNIKQFELNLNDIGLTIAENELVRTVSLRREQKILEFPNNSNRGLNHWGTDSVNFIQSPTYSKASNRLGFKEYNFEISDKEASKLNQTFYEQKPFQNINFKNTRIFSYSDFKINEKKFNYLLNFTNLGNSAAKNSATGIVEVTNQVKYKKKPFWTKPSKNKLKLFIDGNFEKKKLKTGNRVEDILNNKKKVQDRMLLPIKSLILGRKNIVNSLIHDNYKTVPTVGPISKFIEKNDKLLDMEEALKIWINFKNTDSDYNLSINSKNKNELIVINDDLELSVEATRTTARKPHSLYGILWDEYLKQTFNLNLQFIDFNTRFKDIHINNLENLSDFSGLNFRKNIEKALQPDFRYKFTLNDEIKNTVLGKLLPKIGYTREITNPVYQVYKLSDVDNLTFLDEIKEQTKILRQKKKKLKKYIKRKKKFGENPASLKYDLIPQAIKLPYRKKKFWVKNNFEYFNNNHGLEEYIIFRKKNNKIASKSRLENTINFSKNKKGTEKYWNPGNYIEKNSKLLNLENKTKYFKGDMYTTGIENYKNILEDKKYLGIEMFRIRKPNLFLKGGEKLNYILTNTNSKNWIKLDKIRVKQKRNIRLFGKNYLLKNDLFSNLGTLKYINSKLGGVYMRAIPLYKIRSFKEFSEYTDFDNPISNFIRSGDLSIDRLITKENEARLRTLNYLTNTEIFNNYTPTNLTFLKKIKLSTLTQSLVEPYKNSSLENTLFNTEFLTDNVWQNYRKLNKFSFLDTKEIEILQDNWEFYTESSVFGIDLPIAEDLVSLGVANTLEKLKINLKIGKQDITRNPFTYFNLNPWRVTTNTKSKLNLPKQVWTNIPEKVKITKKITKILSKFFKYLCVVTNNYIEYLLKIKSKTIKTVFSKIIVINIQEIIQKIENQKYEKNLLYLWIIFNTFTKIL